eukprot:TRINITY_DN35996_c0_g1_i1.p1 TRINITY_DN35996_c0_g1~~TRINITY_DN35996_c0_g1_i1.p1  ORF type:complete len:159 (-),score=54.50 TRINITY_DN35996_c0_g1_i1:240-716(-)
MQPSVTPQPYRGYLGGIDRPPCCRHERLMGAKDRRILELEAEVKSLQQPPQQLPGEADSDADAVWLLKEEIVRRQHYEALLESQAKTIRDLEEVLRQQHEAVQRIFGDVGTSPRKELETTIQEEGGTFNFGFGQSSEEKEQSTGKATGDSLGRSFFSG